MSGERKKAALKPVTKLEPKKRVPLQEKVNEEKPVMVPIIKEKVVKKEVVKKIVAVKKEEPIIIEEPKEVKQRAKPSENKYVRLVTDANAEERKEISDKVKNGEIKWAYYATDGDKGYHYYLVFKK